MFDFENKKNFFGDIHSNIKFCTLVFSRTENRFNKIKCAFFLETVHDLKEKGRLIHLTPDDLSAMNPNTGTLPVFRDQRDAELLTNIYRAMPVLVDRRTTPPKVVWPVRYTTMFHMTNDSNLFLRADELDKNGWYPTKHSRYQKGNAEAVPLYAGRMPRRPPKLPHLWPPQTPPP
jgi:hypothetical protein